MNLPSGDRAYLSDKVERYCLNLEHPKGKDKAVLFRKRLGITIQNKSILKNALLQAALDVEATLKQIDHHGARYNTRFFMKTAAGNAWVLDCWIIRRTEDFPRLTNAYPVRK